MKKILAALLSCLVVLSLCGCSSGGSAAPAEPKDIGPDEVPASLTEFLWRFTDWYQGNSFDCSATDDSLILDSILGEGSCVDWSQFSDVPPVSHWSDGTSDPRGWCEASGGCYAEYDRKTADSIAMNVFNLTEAQIAKQVEYGDANGLFYAEGDKYYCNVGGIGDPLVEYSVTSASFDGSKYYVNYNCYFDNGEQDELLATYTAVAGQKKDGDKEYWSLYSMNRTDNAQG